VAVDIRRKSPRFGHWTSIILEEGDGRQLWIPPGFAHGFLALSDTADVSYKCTSLYSAASDRCIAWNDPTIAIDWPIRYKDIESWYSYVEKFAGIAGSKDGLPELPDSEVMPGFEMSCLERYFKESLEKNFPGRSRISGIGLIRPS